MSGGAWRLWEYVATVWMLVVKFEGVISLKQIVTKGSVGNSAVQCSVVWCGALCCAVIWGGSQTG